MRYRFSELVDILAFQKMMESFYLATGIPSALVDPENQTLCMAGWQGICTRFHRANPQTECRCKQSDRYVSDHLMDGPYVGYQCMNGLMDYASPIVVDGQHLASIFLGQFLHAPADEAFFRRQAREFGFDEQDYMEALQTVPIISAEKVKAMMAFITDLAESLASRGLEHLHLLETTAELNRGEERFRAIANYTYDWESWIGVDGTLLWVNPAVERFTGYTVEECLVMQDYPMPMVDEADQTRIAAIRAEAIAGSHGNDIELRIRNKDGSLRWASASWQPIYNASGQSLGHRVSVRDITGRKQAEEALTLAYEELESRVHQRTLDLSEANKALRKEIAVHKRTVTALHRSNTELANSKARTALMLRSIQMAGGSLEMDRVLERVAKMLSKAAGVPHTAIYLLNAENGRLERRTDTKSLNRAQRVLVQDWKLDPGQIPLIREALDRKEPMVSQDARSDPRARPDLFPPLDLRSILAVPIRVGDQVLGVAIIYSLKEPHSFTEEEVDLANGIANSVALTIENARLYEEASQRLAETQALQRITSGLLQKAKLEEILDIVCHEALKLTGATGSAVLLLENDQWLRVTNLAGETSSVPARIPIQVPLAGFDIYKGEPVLVNDPAGLQQGFFRDLELQSLLVAPLRVDSSVIGAIAAGNKPEGFTQNDIRIISLFADQAAIVIEHTQLHQREEQNVVNEERGRLARELHDSVSQALFSANLYAEAARMALSSERKEVALENLEKLRGMTREAILEMRLLIFELHPVVLEKEGLIAALQARLAAVEGRAGLETEIRVEGEESLPISISQELYRIAQESLNNIVKHARAHQITLHLKFDDRSISMEIHDDGIGFDPKAARQSGGMGLRGIQERVHRVGGKLRIKSSPQGGTILRVTVPMKETETTSSFDKT